MLKRFYTTLVSVCFILCFTYSYSQTDFSLNLFPSWEECDSYVGGTIVGLEFYYEDVDYVLWDFGDGNVIVDDYNTFHAFYTGGVHLVTATIVGGQFDGLVLEGIYEFEDCFCPEVMNYQGVWDNTQCSVVSFHMPEVYGGDEMGAVITWDWGDGTVETTNSPSGYHTYTTSGTYEVCAVYQSNFCELSSTFCETIDIEICPDESCIQGGEIWVNQTEECLIYEFATSDLYGDWYINGEYLDSDWYVVAPLNVGENSICVNLPANDYCPFGSYECTYVFVEEDSCSSCPEFNYNYSEEECGVVEFELLGDIGQSNVTALILGEETEYWLELPEDQSFAHAFSFPGIYTVIFDGIEGCEDFSSYTISVEIEDCVECEEELYWNEFQCGEVEFEIGSGETVEEVLWSFGDGIEFSGDHYIVHEFEAGEYEICYTYYSLECGEVYSGCQWIYVEGCNESCPEVIITSQECLEATFTYEGNIDGTAYCWEVWQNGVMLTTYFDLVSTTVNFDQSGTYFVGVTNALECNGNYTESIFVEIEVENCESTCGCTLESNLIENGDFSDSSFSNSGLNFSCSCLSNSVCVGSEARDKCNNQYWLLDFYDHTYGTEEGSFLIVDGGEDVVWYDNPTVQAGQLYNFSFWVASEISDNTNNTSYQNLEVVVDGFPLYSFSTQDAPGQEWVQYCAQYYAQESGAISLQLVQTAGFGFNDWGLDDMEFGSCGDQVEDCPEIITYETDECGTFTFDYIGEITNSLYCWEFWGDDFFSTYFDAESTTFTFSEAGTYYATVTNAILCPDQGELIIEIIVPECGGGNECIYAVGGVQTGCTTSILSVYADFEVEEVHWLIDGEIIVAGNNFEYDFGSPENQTIQIAFIPGTSDECTGLLQGWEIPIFMDTSWCQEDCGLELVYEVLEGDNYLFSAYTTTYVEGVTWTINGDELDENGLQMDQVFSEPGTYNVCAQFFSEDCPYGASNCIDVVVTPNVCPEITYTETEECGVYNFEFTGYIDGSLYCWDAWGDGLNISYFDGETTSITFPGPGTYFVAVTNAILCPEYEDYVVQIVVPDCYPECDFEIVQSQVGTECYVYELSISGLSDDTPVSWFAPGTFWGEQESGPYAEVEYTGDGTYFVYATFETEDCGLVTLTTTLELYCYGCEFEMEVFPGEECGEMNFLFPDSAAEIYLDFGDGQTSYGNGDILQTHTYEESGWYAVCVTYFDWDCPGTILEDCVEFYVEGCDFECEYELSVEALGNNTYVFFADTYPDAWTQWLINGEVYNNQNPLTYTFEEEGDHDVCFSMETEFCGTLNDCFEVSVISPEECEGVSISLEGFLDGNSSWLQVLECELEQDGLLVWEGLLSLTSANSSGGVDLCLPEGCYEFSITNGDPLILSSLVFLAEGIDLGDIEVEFDFDLLSGSASIQFAVGTDCETGISELETEINVFPVPATDVLNIQLSEPGLNFEILDLTGRLIHRENNALLVSQLDVKNWSAGLYLIKVQSENGTLIHKFKVSH